MKLASTDLQKRNILPFLAIIMGNLNDYIHRPSDKHYNYKHSPNTLCIIAYITNLV